MNIFPAIDIKNGKCVRLSQGDFAKLETYGDDPVKMAINWVEQGAKNLHIIDLDGALMGEAVNKKLIMDMIQAVNVPIQFGGGVRDMKYVEEMVEAGVTRVILGTSALSNKGFLKEAILLMPKTVMLLLRAGQNSQMLQRLILLWNWKHTV